MDDLIIISEEKTEAEELPIKTRKPKPKEVDYEVEKKEVSQNIQKFDRKVKVFKKNPYSYNSVSLDRPKNVTPTAGEMITNPLYNSVGKMLGVDMAKEWGEYYDKVRVITDWALSETKDEKEIIRFINKKIRSIPTMGTRRINDLYIHIKLSKK